MARIKMTTTRYLTLRRLAWAEAERLRERIEYLQSVYAPESRPSSLLQELMNRRGALLNAIDALDSQFPRQAAEAAEQALRKEME